MIIRTTMPLVAEFGAKVTTAQVARAAGIAEGTIFRVFADKDDLIHACVAEALQPDSVHADIAAIDLDQPLADRLVEAAEALSAYVQRIGTISGALHATGFRAGRSGDADCRPRPQGGRAQVMAETSAVLADLFAPEAAGGTLRRPAAELAAAFFGMLTVVQRGDLPAFGDGPPSAAAIVDLFLYGAISREEKS
ncbi:TetR/AcrR family transcriptional regulator [Catenuloplanes japonicus]|uniref:TetR/AcrR family transcriptional regulator n=1 Tax=Catenuloplanes japonicus TaxID=33876 RepID=UPI0018DC2AC2|nr:TetR/AcrR family transcriptional regulator [Catenuloplanes japonicus]